MDISLDNLQLDVKKSCVIVLGGDAPRANYIKDLVAKAAFCIAADGGADFVLACGRTPDLLVGDMDSISIAGLDACKEQGTTIEQYPVAKDYTDGELAFEAAIHSNYTSCYVVAAAGERFDHVLANVYTAAGLAQAGKDVVLCYDNYIGYIFQVVEGVGHKTLHGQAGDTVSVLSLTPQTVGINLRGFVYPLVDATLPQTRAWGVSNVLAADEAEVELREGMVLILHNFMI